GLRAGETGVVARVRCRLVVVAPLVAADAARRVEREGQRVAAVGTVVSRCVVGHPATVPAVGSARRAGRETHARYRLVAPWGTAPGAPACSRAVPGRRDVGRDRQLAPVDGFDEALDELGRSPADGHFAPQLSDGFGHVE